MADKFVIKSPGTPTMGYAYTSRDLEAHVTELANGDLFLSKEGSLIYKTDSAGKAQFYRGVNRYDIISHMTSGVWYYLGNLHIAQARLPIGVWEDPPIEELNQTLRTVRIGDKVDADEFPKFPDGTIFQVNGKPVMKLGDTKWQTLGMEAPDHMSVLGFCHATTGTLLHLPS